MTRLLLRRLFNSVIALVLASIAVFAAARALPGDPTIALSGEGFDPETQAAVRERYGLDQPIPVQYAKWVGLVLQGDFGRSIRANVPVRQILTDRIPVTLELAAFAILIAIALGVPLGIIAALRRGTAIDTLSNAGALTGLSIPNFWLGMMLIILLSIRFPVLPASGFVPLSEDIAENLRRMAMPAFVLGTGISAVIVRQTRSSMIDTLGADYIRMARAKGLSELSVVGRHALRNSLVTVVTIVGLELGALIAGSVLTETVFLIPGFGRLIIDAIVSRDYPIIQAAALISAFAYIVLNYLVDVFYLVLNPKLRTSGAMS